MQKKKVICSCYHVTKGDLKRAIKNGADSYKEVKKATRIGCACGHCKKKAKKTVKKLLQKYR